MKLEDVRRIATSPGARPGKPSTIKLFKALQPWEGDFDCHSAAWRDECDRVHSCRREDYFHIPQ